MASDGDAMQPLVLPHWAADPIFLSPDVAAALGIHTSTPRYVPPTCYDLIGRHGEPGHTICKHSAKQGCDLRVVALTTYRMGDGRR